ncbi:MAG: NTP transferase domain-containing protein [Kiritimatiellia bacterium]
MHASTRTAIILAAGSPPASLEMVFGRTSSAMVPVNGRPVIHWLIHHLKEIGVSRVVMGVKAGETRLVRFVRQAFGSILELDFVFMESDRGPGFTLLKCLERLPPSSSCLVVLGDTLFEFPPGFAPPDSESYVLLHPVQDAARWCLAGLDDHGRVLRLADKPETNPENWPALIGVYHFASIDAAREALGEQFQNTTESLQIRHALAPYIRAGQLHGIPAGQWYDCGNLDFLTSSRRRMLQVRNFNSIQIDELRGTITKRSSHAGKFLNEINYYRLLPPDLATFFPRLVDFSLAREDMYLTLEYYGYPTLSELWVFEEMDATHWEAIFTLLARVLECFERYGADLSPTETYRFYWQKTLDRIQEFARQSPRFARLAQAEKLTLNDADIEGWPAIRDEVERRVREMAARPAGRIIHGDLCFPNMLYDRVSRLFKFIDPRGSFAEAGILGDARYDIAKLMHSLDGGYDFIIHNMFALQEEETRIQLQVFYPGHRKGFLAAFEKVFSPRFALAEARLIEGLLFLSMCALHSDHPDRQTAMWVTGLRILHQVIHHENMH